MFTIILYLLVMLANVIFMLCCYRDFHVTRDSAYVLFFAVAAVLLISMFFGFLHFKPWLN